MRARQTLISRDWLPIGLSQAAAVACGVAGVHLTTRWVKPEDAGAYGLFLSLTPLGATLTHAGLIKHFSRHWAGAPDRETYVRQWLRASRWATLVLLGASTIAASAGWIPGDRAWVAIALFLSAGAGAYAQAFQLGVQSAARYWTDFGLTVFGSATRTFLPLLAVFATGAGLGALTGGHVVHALAMAGLTAVAVAGLASSRSPGQGRDETPTSLRTYQTVYLIHGALALVNQGAVRWAASLAFDDVTLGHVTLAASLAAVGPNVVSGALWQFSYPRLLARHRTEGPAPMRRLADLTLALYLLACVAGGLVLAWLVPFLSGTLIASSYLPALHFVLPLFAFSTGLCGLTLLQGELLVLDRPQAALRFATAGTALLAGGTLVCAAVSPADLVRWWWCAPAVALGPIWFALRRARAGAPEVQE